MKKSRRSRSRKKARHSNKKAHRSRRKADHPPVEAPRIRLFISHSISMADSDVMQLFMKCAWENGFEPVLGTGATVDGLTKVVRERMQTCRAFAAILQEPRDGGPYRMWVPAEMGMAIALELPRIVLAEPEPAKIAESLVNVGILKLHRDKVQG